MPNVGDREHSKDSNREKELSALAFGHEWF